MPRNLNRLKRDASAIIGELTTVFWPDEITNAQREAVEKTVDIITELLESVSENPAVKVRYLSMPESNGKENWTAILCRADGDIVDGVTLDRSEFPDRVRYAADRARYVIGELKDRPRILDYDADKHSGWKPREA